MWAGMGVGNLAGKRFQAGLFLSARGKTPRL
jgi:hypothetical protein